ncbi:hypothetical protein NFI96_023529, partial [Prochilodus magdalenae]
ICESNMEVEHINPSSHPEDAKQGGDNERGNWYRRLRLRKSSASSLTVKSTLEKEKVKSTTEEEKVVIKSPEILSQNEHQTRQPVNLSSNKLTFTCSVCKDNTMFSPNGLLNHFSVFHGGKGDPPTFPCDMCSFVTPQFPSLQQHRIKHRQCKLTCEICNDDVLQTLSQIRKHCNTQHSLNGQYHCGKCNYSTKDLTSFVYHSCPTTTESPTDSTENSSIKPVNGEMNGNHKAAAKVATQEEKLIKPMATDCRQGWRKKNWWKKKEAVPKHHSINTPDIKVLLKKTETQWPSSGFLPFSAAGITHQSDRLGSLSAPQVQSSKATPEAATEASEKTSTQASVCLPAANAPAMKRKRQREQTTKDTQRPTSKFRKQLVQIARENDSPPSIPYWEPIPQAVERTLRLSPVCSSQPIKVPRLNQPVIVLNHPDTDIPEVVNIMKVVHKHKGAVQKVVLSQGTLKALSELNCDTFRKTLGANSRSSHYRRAWPQETVKERFILKLKLKRLCGNKYKVTPSASKTDRYHLTFRCWFCGRLFKNQETWVGHGQRHLMEATRDWNKLFNSEGQRNSPIQPYFH